jgi:hypothetical protein
VDYNRGLLDAHDPERVSGPDPVEQLGLPFEAPLPVEHTPAAPAPPRKARQPRAKANGVKAVPVEPAPVEASPSSVSEPSTPAATASSSAEEEPPPETLVRTELNRMADIVPGRGVSVVAMLTAIGGASKLLDCPREKWPAIVAAARAAVAEHTDRGDRRERDRQGTLASRHVRLGAALRLP